MRLDQVTIQAKLGSMVAYQGDVKFEYKSGGLGRFFKKAVTGEGVKLMVAGELLGHCNITTLPARPADKPSRCFSSAGRSEPR